MVDVITDTYVMEITIIEHADVHILSVDAPDCVEYNEPFTISYVIQNDGETDTCFGRIMDADTGGEIAGSRWEEDLPDGSNINKSAIIPGQTGAINLRIEVGYVK